MATLKNTVIDDTGYFKIPAGTTAQRPVSPSNGMMRYNTDSSLVEFWNGTSWINVNDSSSYVNALEKYTYTISSGTNTITGADDNSNTLTYATDSSKTLEVYFNGVKQVEGASNDYTATNGTSIVFTFTIPAGSVIEVQVYSLVPVSSLSQWDTSGNNIYYNTGNVGIGGAPSYSLDIGSKTDGMRIPVGTTAQRPSSPANGVIRYNTDNGGVEYYSASRSQWIGVELFEASGGDVFNSGIYRYHVFKTSSSFVVSGSKSIDYIVVAGGGGGGNNNSGGGGAGGFVAVSGVNITSGTYNITIGGGGIGADAAGRSGYNGNNSSFLTSTAIGGGGGMGGNFNTTGGSPPVSGNGGSGGGRSRDVGTAGSGTSGQGFAGRNNPQYQVGGGGGGATEGGGTGSSGGNGTSLYSSWGAATSTGENISGTYWYAGGGGGSAESTGNTSGVGGNGGGGRGGASNGATGAAGWSSGLGENGDANTGGGGGGNDQPVGGGNGGSGIVIIRYPI